MDGQQREQGDSERMRMSELLEYALKLLKNQQSSADPLIERLRPPLNKPSSNRLCLKQCGIFPPTGGVPLISYSLINVVRGTTS